ncbi:TetR/AcrR family transcriptional regulator [Nocardia flavorosea]|uniref:TetR/AcrR family transcriptional regulator n=1 Tax=Nocardia flavorosea TaxID=53429 RepID=UPI001895097C|nr:TetR/AcrR family transcriptional regulator [Nocardia flavorosea]MBF6352752.1 TetR/AcrR family transcriptional regulator [Nocardia flavorosea]
MSVDNSRARPSTPAVRVRGRDDLAGDGADARKSTGDLPARPVRRRPKNRRAQIAAAAANAFGSLGYHGVSMEDIAGGLGISSAALYRHYPSKYALFQEESLRVGQAMAESVRLPADAADLPPQQALRQVLEALSAVTVANRASVALVRWEGRYLEPADQEVRAEQQAVVLDALESRLTAYCPGLSNGDRKVLAISLLSVITSIADHHAALPTKPLVALLVSICAGIAEVTLPPPVDTAPAPPVEIPDSFKHELLLRKGVELFHARGYPNVSVEDIATAAGLSAASAVYRFYRGKSDLLTAAFRRAAERVSSAIGPAVASAAGPREALDSLIEQYVAGSFAERELTFVYYTEFQHVPAEERAALRNVQRLSVDEWARLVRQVRPDLSGPQARFLVHAAFALVVDLGRSFGTVPIASQERVTLLMQTVLYGHPAGS